MQLYVHPYDIGRFAHNPGEKTLAIEASDLNWMPGYTDFVPLYDDACDVGIAVVNSRTCIITHWYLVNECVVGGDLVHWNLKPTNESCRKHPGVQNYTMRIYND